MIVWMPERPSGDMGWMFAGDVLLTARVLIYPLVEFYWENTKKIVLGLKQQR